MRAYSTFSVEWFNSQRTYLFDVCLSFEGRAKRKFIYLILFVTDITFSSIQKFPQKKRYFYKERKAKRKKDPHPVLRVLFYGQFD